MEDKRVPWIVAMAAAAAGGPLALLFAAMAEFGDPNSDNAAEYAKAIHEKNAIGFAGMIAAALFAILFFVSLHYFIKSGSRRDEGNQ